MNFLNLDELYFWRTERRLFFVTKVRTNNYFLGIFHHGLETEARLSTEDDLYSIIFCVGDKYAY